LPENKLHETLEDMTVGFGELRVFLYVDGL